jgi:hypothetical protein
MSPTDFWESPFVNAVYSAITSDVALWVVLFFAGGCCFAWISHWIERLEKGSDYWAIYWLGQSCEGGANLLTGGFLTRLANMPKEIQRLNEVLERFDLEPIPAYDPDDKERNERSARYLRAIYPSLQRRDLDAAQTIGRAILNREKEKAVARRSPLGTG